MSCEQMELLRHLVVETPEALQEENWELHFGECGECLAEWEAYGQSLAVFRQLEAERLSRLPTGPSWGSFSATLRVKSSWGARAARWGLPLRAAAAAVAIMAAGATWYAWSGAEGMLAGTVAETVVEKAVEKAVEKTAGPKGIHTQGAKPAALEKWIVTDDQLQGAPLRALGPGSEDQQPVVFEIRVNSPFNRSLREGREQIARSVLFNSGQAGQSLPAKISENRLWRPPLATSVSKDASRLQTPASFRPSR